MSATASKDSAVQSAPQAPLSKKAPITLGIFAVLAVLLLIVFGRSGTAELNFTASNAGAIQLPTLVMDGRPTTLVITIIAILMAAGSVLL
jgi:general nucleoside transport system permease protein